MIHSKREMALVIAPHTDDAELGAGAVMAKLIERGASIQYLALSTGHPSQGATEAECRAAVVHALGLFDDDVRILDFQARHFPAQRQEILDTLVHARHELWMPPDWVFGPSSFSRHQDHQVVHAEMQRAFPAATVLGYWTPDTEGFHGKLCWPVEERHVEAKYSALTCYKSQADRDYMKPEVVWGKAILAALGMGEIARFAERFEVLRWANP